MVETTDIKIPAPAETPAVSDQTPIPIKQKPQESKGEKWFNGIFYTGINYFVNLGLSLVIADFFTHGKGKGFFEGGVKKLGGESKFRKGFARTGMEQFTLNLGGWVLLVPMKIAEDHKRPIVHWLNKKLGVNQIAADGHEETPDEIYIKKEIKPQSWGRAIGRRALGTFSTMVFGWMIDPISRKRDKPVMRDGEMSETMGGKERFTELVKTGSQKVLNSGYIPGGVGLAKKAWVDRYVSNAALDAINTGITAGVYGLTNGAKEKHMPSEIDDGAASAKRVVEVKAAGKPQPASSYTDLVSKDAASEMQVSP